MIVHIHTCTFLYMYIGLVRESPHILVWYSCSLHYIIVVYVFFFVVVISAMDTIYLMCMCIVEVLFLFVENQCQECIWTTFD